MRDLLCTAARVRSDYDNELAAAVQKLDSFKANEAARIAHSMHISYLYVDVTDRRAYPGVAKFDASPQFFQPVFRSGDAAVYAVR